MEYKTIRVASENGVYQKEEYRHSVLPDDLKGYNNLDVNEIFLIDAGKWWMQGLKEDVT